MNNLLKNSKIRLSEQLMIRGWWKEAEAAIAKSDMTPSNRILQKCLMEARRECVEWINERKNQPISTRDLLREFDRYTVFWALHDYMGKDSAEWQLKSAKVSDLMD